MRQRLDAVLILSVGQDDDAVAYRIAGHRPLGFELLAGQQDGVVEGRATLRRRARDVADQVFADGRLGALDAGIDALVEGDPEKLVLGADLAHELLGALDRGVDLGVLGHAPRLVEDDGDRGVLTNVLPDLADAIDGQRVGHGQGHQVRLGIGAVGGLDGDPSGVAGSAGRRPRSSRARCCPSDSRKSRKILAPAA